MNKNQIIGKWDQIKGDIQRQWGKLTDDQLTTINGDMTKLAGLIRESYGISQEETQQQLDRFFEDDADGTSRRSA